MNPQKKISRKIFALGANFFFIASQFLGTPAFSASVFPASKEEPRPVTASIGSDPARSAERVEKSKNIQEGTTVSFLAQDKTLVSESSAFDETLMRVKREDATKRTEANQNSSPKKIQIDLEALGVVTGSLELGPITSPDLANQIPADKAPAATQKIETLTETAPAEVSPSVKTLSAQNSVVAEYPVSIGQGTSVKLYSDGSYDFTYQGEIYSSSNGEVTILDAKSGPTRLKLTFDQGQLQQIDVFSQTGILTATIQMERVNGETRVQKIKTFYDNGYGRLDYTVDFNYANQTAFYRQSDMYDVKKYSLKSAADFSKLVQFQGGLRHFVQTIWQLGLPKWQTYKNTAANDGSRFFYAVNGATVDICAHGPDAPCYSATVDTQNQFSFSVPQSVGQPKVYLGEVSASGSVTLTLQSGYSTVIWDGLVITANTGQKFQFHKEGTNLYVTLPPATERFLVQQDLNQELYFKAPLYGALETYGITVKENASVEIWLQNRTVLRPVSQYPIAIGTGTSVKLFSDGSYELYHMGKTFKSDVHGVIKTSDGGIFKINFDLDQKPVSFTFDKTVTFGNQVWKYSSAASLETDGKGGYQVSRYSWSRERADLGLVVKGFEFDFNKRYSKKIDNWQALPGQAYVYESFYATDLDSLKTQVKVGADLYDIGHIDDQRISCAQDCFSLQYGPGEELQEVIYTPNLQGDYPFYSVLKVGALDFGFDSMLKVAASSGQALAVFKGMLKDDRLVNLGTVNSQFVTLTADDGAKINFPQGLNQTNQGSVSQLSFWGSATYMSQGYLTQTDDQGRVTLTLDQKDGTKKTYLVKIDDQGQVSLELQNPVDSGVIRDGLIVTANTGQKFQFKTEDNELCVYALPGGERYVTKRDLNNEMYFQAPLYDAMEIYGVTIKSPSEVTIWLQNRTVQRPIAEYPVAIGTGTSLKAYSDGSHHFIFHGQDYAIDAAGVAQLAEGTTGKFQFDQAGIVKKISVYGLNNRITSEIFFKSGLIGGNILIDYVRFYPDVNASGIYVNEIYVDWASKSLSRQMMFKNNTAESEETFFTSATDFTLDVEFGSNGNVILLKDFPSFLTSDQAFAQVVREGVNRPLKNYSIRINGTYYELLVQGDLDAGEAALSSLQDRTLEGFSKLLKDDKLVRFAGSPLSPAPQQSVTASDGQVFSLYPRLIWSDVQVNPDQLLFTGTAGGKLTKLIASADAQGKITFRVPDESGAMKVYEVKIDAAGKVSLTLQNQGPTMEALRDQALAVQNQFASAAGNPNITMQELMNSYMQTVPVLHEIARQAAKQNYQTLVPRLNLAIEAVRRTRVVVTFWIASRDSNGEQLQKMSVETANQMLANFRVWMAGAKQTLTNYPDGALAVYDNWVLAELPKVEDAFEEIAVSVEYTHLADPFRNLGEGTTVEQVEALLVTFQSQWQILREKAVSWNLTYLVQDLDVFTAQFIASVRAQIASHGG